MCKEVFRLGGLVSKGKAVDKLTLGQLLKEIEQTDLPDIAKRCLKSVADFGNFGSHEQGREDQHLDEALVGSVIAQYEKALVLFRGWLSEKPGT